MLYVLLLILFALIILALIHVWGFNDFVWRSSPWGIVLVVSFLGVGAWLVPRSPTWRGTLACRGLAFLPVTSKELGFSLSSPQEIRLPAHAKVIGAETALIDHPELSDGDQPDSIEITPNSAEGRIPYIGVTFPEVSDVDGRLSVETGEVMLKWSKSQKLSEPLEVILPPGGLLRIGPRTALITVENCTFRFGSKTVPVREQTRFSLRLMDTEQFLTIQAGTDAPDQPLRFRCYFSETRGRANPDARVLFELSNLSVSRLSCVELFSGKVFPSKQDPIDVEKESYFDLSATIGGPTSVQKVWLDVHALHVVAKGTAEQLEIGGETKIASGFEVVSKNAVLLGFVALVFWAMDKVPKLFPKTEQKAQAQTAPRFLALWRRGLGPGRRRLRH